MDTMNNHNQLTIYISEANQLIINYYKMINYYSNLYFSKKEVLNIESVEFSQFKLNVLNTMTEWVKSIIPIVLTMKMVIENIVNNMETNYHLQFILTELQSMSYKNYNWMIESVNKQIQIETELKERIFKDLHLQLN